MLYKPPRITCLDAFVTSLECQSKCCNVTRMSIKGLVPNQKPAWCHALVGPATPSPVPTLPLDPTPPQTHGPTALKTLGTTPSPNPLDPPLLSLPYPSEVFVTPSYRLETFTHPSQGSPDSRNPSEGLGSPHNPVGPPRNATIPSNHPSLRLTPPPSWARSESRIWTNQRAAEGHVTCQSSLVI